jgi:hypothetical protein
MVSIASPHLGKIEGKDAKKVLKKSIAYYTLTTFEKDRERCTLRFETWGTAARRR